MQIRERIEGIRSSIIAKQAAGIVAPGTEDWTLTGPDGVTVDRATYLARAEATMARVVAVASLTTTIDRLEFKSSDVARIELTQTMVRVERAADGKGTTRLWLHYREEHTWVQAADGWRVRKVVFVGTPERRVLADGEAPPKR